MLSGERLLIVEDEFLIALDIQRVLEDAHAATAVFARNYKELSSLEARFPEFDLAIVTPPRPGTGERAVVEKLASAGPALVICSANTVELADTPLGDVEIVYKPFSDTDLLAACRRALARRNPA